MKVLLLPLVWQLLCGEALSDTFLSSRRESRPIFYVLPSQYPQERVMAAHQAMMNRQIAEQSIPEIVFRGQLTTESTNVGSARIIESRPFAATPPISHIRQGSHTDDDSSSFIRRKRPSDFDLDRRLTGSNQVHTSSSTGHSQTPSLTTQDPRISSFNQVPKVPTFNQDHRLSVFDQTPRPSTSNETPKVFGFIGDQNPSLVFSQTTKPSTLNEDPRPSSFAGGQHPSSVFNQTPRPSIFVGQNPPSVFNQTPKPSGFDSNLNASVPHTVPKPSVPEKGRKPSSSDEDVKHSRFDQDQKPLFPPPATHPRRNPVCNIRPDPGTCRAALPRYYFDHQTGTCNCFLYGGCRDGGKGESLGSFFTLNECQRECWPPRHEEGPTCREIFKEEQFISYLVVDTSTPTQNKRVDLTHLNNKEFLASFTK